MPDRKPRPDRTTPHKDKICKACRRTFEWRRQWEQDWDIVKYCSDVCSGYQPGEADAALEAAILSLLADRAVLDPAEAAKAVGGRQSRRDWEALLQPARTIARRLAAAGKIVLLQHGAAVNPVAAKGHFLLRLR